MRGGAFMRSQRAGQVRLLALLLALALAAAAPSCGRDGGRAEGEVESARLISPQPMLPALYRDGAYRIAQGDEQPRVEYYDFNEGSSEPLCLKENCPHRPWTRETPEEERCDAYWGGEISALFVHAERLYVFGGNLPQEFTLLCCERDGSGHRELAGQVNLLSKLYADGGQLYFGRQEALLKESEDGAPTFNTESRMQLQRLDLASGRVEAIGPSYRGHFAGLRLLGAHGGRLYYYVAGQFEAPAPEEERLDYRSLDIRFYAYDMADRSTRECFTDAFSADERPLGGALIYGDWLYTYLVDTSRMYTLSGVAQGETLREGDLSAEKMYERYFKGKLVRLALGGEGQSEPELLDEIKVYATLPSLFFEDWVIYEDFASEDGALALHLGRGEKHAFSARRARELLPDQVQEGYMLFSRLWPEDRPKPPGLIGTGHRITAAAKLEDYFALLEKGDGVPVPVHYFD